RSSSSCPTKLPRMTMPFETWKGMISSSMNFTHFSRCPGFVRYCRNSKNIACSLYPYRLLLLYTSRASCTRKSPQLPQAWEHLFFQPTQEGIGTGIAGLITPPDGVNVEGGQGAHTVSNCSARTDAKHGFHCRVRHKGRDPLGFFPIHGVPQVRVQPGKCPR